MLAGGDADCSGWSFAQFAQRRQLGVDFVEARRNDGEKPLAGLSWRDAAGRAGQEANAEARFQRANGVAERRLRHAELSRRIGEVSLPCRRNEGDDVVEGAFRYS
jgi:hypothetical protein